MINDKIKQIRFSVVMTIVITESYKIIKSLPSFDLIKFISIGLLFLYAIQIDYIAYKKLFKK